MFLIDPADLTVYSLPESELTNNEVAGQSLNPIAFKAFEEAAQKSYSHLILAAAQGYRPYIRPSTLVFVRLRQEGRPAYVWASRVSVNHVYDYPILHNPCLGEDFLLLWPFPMAIHSWVGFKERARVSGAGLDAPSRLVVDHPPSLCRQDLSDIPHEGRVALHKLTMAQRFFVATLRPNLPRFALRQPGDDWCARLNEIYTASAPSAQLPPPRTPARPRASAPLDLPDELIGRVVSLRLAEDLYRIEMAVAAVAQLSLVSRQFCACTRDTVARVLARASTMWKQLNGPEPVPVSHLQLKLWALGLTLRSTFAIDLGKWPVYVRERRKLLQYERGRWREPDDAAKRHALLFE